uniref:Uncharacterized protein n=1 Tax=Haptolina brevifila TaxID=156173 RepID=A0A7S2NML6_9EUKA|mmetsp:Transcript_84236/g.168168  ORF Transcript_84236/g.168168 Transcript_84236/m.168168 type:complete len:204 (+) Transcript_84236:157-768(+)
MGCTLLVRVHEAAKFYVRGEVLEVLHRPTRPEVAALVCAQHQEAQARRAEARERKQRSKAAPEERSQEESRQEESRQEESGGGGGGGCNDCGGGCNDCGDAGGGCSSGDCGGTGNCTDGGASGDEGERIAEAPDDSNVSGAAGSEAQAIGSEAAAIEMACSTEVSHTKQAVWHVDGLLMVAIGCVAVVALGLAVRRAGGGRRA